MCFEIGALNTPQVENASKNIMSKDHKDLKMLDNGRTSSLSWSVLNSDKKYRTSNATSTSSADIANEGLYNGIALAKKNISRNAMNAVVQFDNCEFPYYRNSGQLPDAVLVKDVGVSCAIFSGNSFDRNPSTPGIESYLAKQLRAEYNELFNITRKITRYTKDIMSHLLQRDRRKQEFLQKDANLKQVILRRISDKSSSTTKLKICNDIDVQCSIYRNISDPNLLRQQKYITPRKCSNYVSAKNKFGVKSFLQPEDLKMENGGILENTLIKGKKKISINSFAYNGSSVYDYLMMERRISCDEILRKIPRKLSHRESCGKADKKYDCNKREDRLKKCDSLIFTNWKEISKAVALNDKTLRPIKTSNGSKPSACLEFVQNNYPKINEERLWNNKLRKNLQNNKLSPNRSARWPSWENNVIGRSGRTDLHDTHFHTINIRIVKQKRRRM